MKSVNTEAPPSVWDSLYRRRKTPWRSVGLGSITGRLLSSYAAGGRLLEVGCGLGEDAAEIADLGFGYHGLDISQTAIRIAMATKRDDAMAFTHADFFRWSAEKPFDVIYEKGFFHGLSGVRRRNKFVSCVASNLAPKGIWISVCGAADSSRKRFSHGAIYLRDLVGPAEIYFEILEIVKDRYGVADSTREFQAWHAAFRRY